MEIQTTGIGSLPHINVDAAIQYSFRHDIPFLPQLPIYNPNEYMIYQALEQFPGILKPQKGISHLDLKIWLKHRPRLKKEIQKAEVNKNYSSFLPSPEALSALNSFTFELENRKSKQAKLQIAGPFTLIQSLKLTDHSSILEFPDLVEDVFSYFKMSLKAYIQHFQSPDRELIIFIDEPGLVIFNKKNQQHLKWLSDELEIIKELRQDAVSFGVHCCADADWNYILSEAFWLDYLSFDLNVSGHGLLKTEDLEVFLHNTCLSVGVVETNLEESRNYEARLNSLIGQLNKKPNKVLVSAACGLAHRSISDTEAILSALIKEQADTQ
ncbi:MAG: hypothetical protein AB8E15_13885 [Bdellovibrionales bacterium]